jgi:hypothetical protein
MLDANDKVFGYLTQLIGLCQTPHDAWSVQDRAVLREARDYVRQQLKSKIKENECESGCEKTSGRVDGVPEKQSQSGKASGEVAKDGHSLKEGAQDTGIPSSENQLRSIEAPCTPTKT